MRSTPCVDGCCGPIEIVRTRYIDFADAPPWRAVREIAG